MRVAVVSQDIGFTPYTEQEIADGAEGAGTQFPGGSLWYRYLSPLKASGVEHVQGVLTTDRKRQLLGITRFADGVDDFDFDVIALQRIVFPQLPEAIIRARSNGQIVINDMDDWFDGLPPTNNAFRTMAATFDNGAQAQRVYRDVLAASDLIFCSTPFLADWYAKYAPTCLWRNAIDFDSFPMQREQRAHPQYGWFGALRFRAKDIEELSGIIGPFVERNDVEFVHVGHEFAEIEKKPDKWGRIVDTLNQRDDANDVARRTGMSPRHLVKLPPTSFIESSILLYSGFDVGVVPLEQIRFNNAKSALKGMEYAASGIPFVASPSDEYRRLQSLGIGRVADKPKWWQRHLTALLDYDTRVAEAKRNRELLQEHYDVKKTAPAWREALESLL